MKTDIRVTEALARLKVTEPHIMEWLKGRLARHQHQMETQKDEVAVRWAQGRAQELKDQIKELESAADTLGKVRR